MQNLIRVMFKKKQKKIKKKNLDQMLVWEWCFRTASLLSACSGFPQPFLPTKYVLIENSKKIYQREKLKFFVHQVLWWIHVVECHMGTPWCSLYHFQALSISPDSPLGILCIMPHSWPIELRLCCISTTHRDIYKQVLRRAHGDNNGPSLKK